MFAQPLFCVILILLDTTASGHPLPPFKSDNGVYRKNQVRSVDAITFDGRTDNDRESRIIQVSLIPATDSLGASNQVGVQNRNVVSTQAQQFNANLENSVKNAKSLGSTASNSPNQQISDAIVYPDAFSKYPKDSYGNQVQPYAAINEDREAQLGGTDIGFMTDVNKDTYKIVNKGVLDTNKPIASNNNIPFVVPSYASGILETVPTPNPSLLSPPVSSGTFSNTQTQVSVGQSSLNTNAFPQSNFQSNKPQQPLQNILPPVNSQSAYSGINSYQAETTTVKSTKYTGGFNGAPGVLGDQKTPGFAVKPPLAAPSQQPLEVPSTQVSQFPLFQQQQPAPPAQQPQPIQPPTPAQSTAFQNSFVPVPANGLVPPKLPGVIYDYSSLPGVEAISSITFKPQTASAQNPGQSQFSNNNNNNFVTPTQSTQYQNNVQPTLSVDLSVPVKSPGSSSYSPSSGFPSTAPVNTQQPQNNKNTVNKYTGGFGGAPGILGDQKVPGTAVGPSSSPSASSSAGAASAVVPRPSVPTAISQPILPPAPASQSPTIIASASNPTKYTGGFGGPPGILSPYDNVKKGGSYSG